MKLSFPEAEVTRSLSSNLYKAGWYVVNDDARMIDTNELAEQRLREAAIREMQYGRETMKEDGEDTGFAEGLNAESIDGLFAAEESGAVLKSASVQEKELLDREIEAAREELEMTKAKAEQMLADAQAEIDKMAKNERNEAEKRGYEEGYRRGLEEVEALKSACVQKEKQLEQEYEQKFKELEPAFVEHLTGIYEHIFQVDLSAYRTLVRHLLVDAMQKMGDHKSYMIHVSKKDYPDISSVKTMLQEEAGAGGAAFEIVADATLGNAQCMIETEGGVYDCSLGTELAELKRKLRLLSYQS